MSELFDASQVAVKFCKKHNLPKEEAVELLIEIGYCFDLALDCDSQEEKEAEFRDYVNTGWKTGE